MMTLAMLGANGIGLVWGWLLVHRLADAGLVVISRSSVRAMATATAQASPSTSYTDST